MRFDPLLGGDPLRGGECFKVETSYGDNGLSWFVYRRARRSIAGFVECHRFETRADGMRAMYPQDSIRTEMLTRQVSIREEEWEEAWTAWQRTVLEPWDV